MLFFRVVKLVVGRTVGDQLLEQAD